MLLERLQEKFLAKLRISTWLLPADPRSPLDVFVQEVSVQDCTPAEPLSSTAGSKLRALAERMAAEEGGVTTTPAPTAHDPGNKH